MRRLLFGIEVKKTGLSPIALLITAAEGICGDSDNENSSDDDGLPVNIDAQQIEAIGNERHQRDAQ